MPGDHGTTYGGNLLACRAALVVLDALEGGLMNTIAQRSARLFEGLRSLAARHPRVVREVRGAGLMAGLDLHADAQPAITAALDRRLLVNRTSTTVIRLLPPYIVSDDEIGEAVATLDEVLGGL
jgi:acetylornithine/succinyldiaminopimelate/putrescine aminotransferase